MTALRLRRLLSVTVTAAVVACGWHFLAPPALGGSTTYVFTDGVSMQPRFHSGDLAVVRARGSYHVGEIAAYHSRMLGTIVLHRIVAVHGGRYVFKGDNNPFRDPEHPSRSQLVGTLWIHVPHALRYLSALRSPFAVGGLVGGALLVLLGGAATQRRRRRRRGGARRDSPAPQPVRTTPTFAGLVDAGLGTVALGAAALLVVSTLLAVVARTHPTTTRVSHPLAYRETGAFSYAGRVRRSVAYPGGRVRSGEPVFLKLVHDLRVRFAYSFSSRPHARLTGTIALVARLQSSAGWSRAIPIAPKRHFDGEEASAVGTLDVAKLPRLLARLEQTTTVDDQYALTFAARVRTDGSLAGQPLETHFEPVLRFSVDQAELRTAAPALGSDHPSDPYHPSSRGSLPRTRLVPAVLSLHGIGARVDVLRRRSLEGCAGAGLLLLLAGGTLVVRRRRRGEAARIRARYGPWIVPVSRLPAAGGGEVVHVPDVESLAKLAERYDLPILHEVGEDGRDGYAVADDGIRYVYRPPAAAIDPEPAPEPDAAPRPLTARLWMDRLGLVEDGEPHHPGQAA